MPHQRSNFIFGVEGPAASGKSTMANTVGEELGIKVVDGGWFFRRLAYEALEKQVPLYRDRVSPELIELAQAMPPQQPSDMPELYDERVTSHVSFVAPHLDIRTAVYKNIRRAVCQHDKAIYVGRVIRLTFPEERFPNAHVLGLTLTPEEIERRRKLDDRPPVHERNRSDAEIARRLGAAGTHDITVDVTNLTPEEQADELRKFIEDRLL